MRSIEDSLYDICLSQPCTSAALRLKHAVTNAYRNYDRSEACFEFDFLFYMFMSISSIYASDYMMRRKDKSNETNMFFKHVFLLLAFHKRMYLLMYVNFISGY